MLHRKLNGKSIDIEQLKNIMDKAKKNKEA